MIFWLLVACARPSSDGAPPVSSDSGRPVAVDSGDSGGDSCYVLDICPIARPTIAWGADGVTFVEDDARVTGFAVGMAQDATTMDDPWTGEDCLQGDTVDGATYQVCHHFDGTTGALSYVSSPSEVDERSTLLRGSEAVDWLVFFDDFPDCYVFGGPDAEDYYAEWHCPAYP